MPSPRENTALPAPHPMVRPGGPCPSRKHHGRRAGISRAAASVALSASSLLLAGCANLTSVPPGTPLAQVEAQFGAPTLQCTDRAGQPRAVWSQQPFGQHAWATTLQAGQRVGPVEPILTDAHFQQLKDGTWTPDEVRCAFGPPAIIDTVGLPGNRQIVWSYRYRENHVWNSLMFVYFGTDGQRVTRFHPGPDPMYEQVDRFERW